jgi:hypothetical protein
MIKILFSIFFSNEPLINELCNVIKISCFLPTTSTHPPPPLCDTQTSNDIPVWGHVMLRFFSDELITSTGIKTRVIAKSCFPIGQYIWLSCIWLDGHGRIVLIELMYIVVMPFDWTIALSPVWFWFVHNSMNLFCISIKRVFSGVHACVNGANAPTNFT